MRSCTRCGVEKPLESFSAHPKGKHGKQPRCKSCCTELSLARYYADPEAARVKRKAHYARTAERSRAYSLAWYQANKAQALKSCKDWVSRNKEKAAEIKLRWKQRNIGYTKAKVAERRASVKRATPAWLSAADRASICAVYEMAARVSACLGTPHHVDHIHPLNGAGLCGLHVPWNL